MLKEILTDAENKMTKTLEHLKAQLATLHTGAANPALIENLVVPAYNSTLTLKELAAISAPGPTELLVQPWDISVLENIESAIRKSDLSLNPAVTENSLRIPIPQLSSERRSDLLKVLGHKVEETRISIRNIRQEKIQSTDGLCDEGKISEDEHARFKKDLQTIVDKYNETVETLKKSKSQEIDPNPTR